MNVSLIINSHEIREYIAEGGITISDDVRSEKSIVTKNGNIYKHSIIKKKLSINLLDNLYGEKFTTLYGYFATNPATVSFSNYATGQTFSGTFYIEDITYATKKSYGNDVLITSASFSLIEV